MGRSHPPATGIRLLDSTSKSAISLAMATATVLGSVREATMALIRAADGGNRTSYDRPLCSGDWSGGRSSRYHLQTMPLSCPKRQYLPPVVAAISVTGMPGARSGLVGAAAANG